MTAARQLLVAELPDDVDLAVAMEAVGRALTAMGVDTSGIVVHAVGGPAVERTLAQAKAASWQPGSPVPEHLHKHPLSPREPLLPKEH